MEMFQFEIPHIEQDRMFNVLEMLEINQLKKLNIFHNKVFVLFGKSFHSPSGNK